MSGLSNEINRLQKRIEELEEENRLLKDRLESSGIDYGDITFSGTESSEEKYDPDQGARIRPFIVTDKIANQFFMLFCRGRKDVYELRYCNPRTGKTGYYTQCFNRWDSKCHIQKRDKVRCKDCEIQAYNTDFEVLVNPTGRFEICGPFADTGVTGRKLACDTYGGVGHIGGGAMSGKDPSKVDRSAAYAARKVARDIVLAGYADKCEIQIAYAIGVAEPVSIHVETFGTEYQSEQFIEQFIRENYDLTPKGIIDSLHLKDFDYSEVAAYGHFGKPGLPWER